MNLPPGLPPLPPVPDGYDVNAWAYRGTNWNPGEFRNYAYYKPGLSDGWVPSFGMKPIGSSGHYIEAVREPAEPSAQLFATLDPKNGEEASACPECVQGYVQETGFDRCDKCNPEPSSGKTSKCPHCGSGLLWSEDRGAHCDGCDDYEDAPASGVESRVCDPPLGGRWRHSNGVLCCGTLRIAVDSFDTDPSPEFQSEIWEWVCDTLNKAQDAPPTERSDHE